MVGNHDIPIEKVVIFDEAQRAWTRQQAASFMQRKRGKPDFNMSEPEFLISVMDRHLDWCTIICLVGGGQEINTGEAGISEWMTALECRFPNSDVYVSPRVSLPEYGSQPETKAFLACSGFTQTNISISTFRCVLFAQRRSQSWSVTF
jgi:hypothetical protein